jgi:probable rRNA maturation factor
LARASARGRRRPAGRAGRPEVADRTPEVTERTPEVVLQSSTRWVGLDGTALRHWLEELLAAVAPDHASLGVRLCGDRSMRAINRDFRARDEVTDVLSFPSGGDPQADGLEGGHLGDVVLCVPQAKRQAERLGHSLGREVETLLLHGVLHCQGYDHETDRGEMDRLERRLRRRWVRND